MKDHDPQEDERNHVLVITTTVGIRAICVTCGSERPDQPLFGCEHQQSGLPLGLHETVVEASRACRPHLSKRGARLLAKWRPYIGQTYYNREHYHVTVSATSDGVTYPKREIRWCQGTIRDLIIEGVRVFANSTGASQRTSRGGGWSGLPEMELRWPIDELCMGWCDEMAAHVERAKESWERRPTKHPVREYTPHVPPEGFH